MSGSYSLRWTAAPIEGSQQLVISPRNGRSYIVDIDSDEYDQFLRIAGLDENAKTGYFDYMLDVNYVRLQVIGGSGLEVISQPGYFLI